MDKGVAYMLMATLFLAIMQVMVKLLPGIPIAQIIFIRAVVSISLAYTFIRWEGINLKGKRFSLLVIRGLVGVASLITFFYTLQNVPLATAVTIGNLSPVFLGILAGIFLKDKMHPLQWLTLFISFAGVYMIKGFDPRVSGTEMIIAVASALLAALAHFTVRLLKEENALVVLFYFSAVMIPVLAPFVLMDWVNPDTQEWIYLLLTALVSHFGQWSLTKALKTEKISRILGFYYLGIFLAVAFGYIIFGETFNFLTIAGMILILGGIFFNEMLKKISKYF